MPGRREPRGAAVSDLRRRAAGAPSGGGGAGTRPCCPGPGPGADARGARRPDPGEPGGGWGEFEGFREPSARAAPFALAPALLERRPSVPAEPRPAQPRQGGPPAAAGAARPSPEPILSYENIFRSAFQEVPVEQATEDISTIEHFLGVSSEEHPGRPAVHRLCCDSRRLWKALQSSNPASVTHYLWRGSCCQERLLLLLGIEANQSLSGGQDPILEGSGLGEPGELVAVSAFPLWPCKALIQTKLSGTPGSPRGSLVTYSLFLKTPLHGHEPSFAAPQEKTFPPHSLKVAFFNDVC